MNKIEVRRIGDDGISRVEANGALNVRFRGSAATVFELDRLLEQNLSRGVRIDEGTARCRWVGDRMDYGLAVESLIWLRDRAREAASIQATQAARA